MEVEQTAESRMQQTMAQLLKQNPAPDKEQNQMAWVPVSYTHLAMRLSLSTICRVAGWAETLMLLIFSERAA